MPPTDQVRVEETRDPGFTNFLPVLLQTRAASPENSQEFEILGELG